MDAWVIDDGRMVDPWSQMSTEYGCYGTCPHWTALIRFITSLIDSLRLILPFLAELITTSYAVHHTTLDERQLFADYIIWM